MKNEKIYIELGRCQKPHGIKGGFSFVLENESDSSLTKGQELKIFPYSKESSVSDSGELVKIKNIAFGNKVIVYFDGIDNRNKVEEMIPFTIKINRDDFPKINNDDEYYLSDLVGMKVLNSADETEIGSISHFYENGVQTILVIKTDSNDIEIPLVDSFVEEIDLAKKVILIRPPEYID